MLHIGNRCMLQGLLRQINNTRNLTIRNGIQKNYFGNSIWIRKPIANTLKLNFLRGGSTIAVNTAVESSSNAKKQVGYWLMTCTGMVFVAVVLGGVTRLTESGLSMVTWKLMGEKMPRSQAEWEEEFKKYQEFPEYKIKNKNMSLTEFKAIWYMEFGHRMWGRLIGAAFVLPATYFWMSGKLSKSMKPRVLVYGTMIGLQGLMGWYMVKSGLEDRFDGESDVPRVSQYRLATHLILAIVLYTGLLYGTLNYLRPPTGMPGEPRSITKSAFKFKMLAHGCKGMVILTALSGAFVAGLDAGLVYNSFPKMADKWIPDEVLVLSPKISNFTENPTTVQLQHRILGTTTLTLISALWIVSRRRKLPTRAYTAANAFLAMAWLQVAMGITTLLTYVPVPMAACHQSGSLALLSTAVWLTHELKRLPK